VATEGGFGLLTGGLSTASRLGQAALALDAAGNLYAAGRGVANAYENGLSFQNSVQIIGGGLGLGGNLATGRAALAELGSYRLSFDPATVSTGGFGGVRIVVSVPQSTGTRFGPHVAGPLPAKVAGTFRGGSYSQVALQSDTVLYRTYGGTSQNPIGSYWSRTPPSGPLQARMDLALPPGNTAQGVTQIRVPQGTVIFEGSAGPNFGQLGGGNQVYIPKVNPGWVQP
jgi:hypothetical protein